MRSNSKKAEEYRSISILYYDIDGGNDDDDDDDDWNDNHVDDDDDQVVSSFEKSRRSTTHPLAIYTSRLLSPFINSINSVNSECFDCEITD